MAFKRSWVRSPPSPPKNLVLQNKVFLFKPIGLVYNDTPSNRNKHGRKTVAYFLLKLNRPFFKESVHFYLKSFTNSLIK